MVFIFTKQIKIFIHIFMIIRLFAQTLRNFWLSIFFRINFRKFQLNPTLCQPTDSDNRRWGGCRTGPLWAAEGGCHTQHVFYTQHGTDGSHILTLQHNGRWDCVILYYFMQFCLSIMTLCLFTCTLYKSTDTIFLRTDTFPAVCKKNVRFCKSYGSE